jgi:hypothetical protein
METTPSDLLYSLVDEIFNPAIKEYGYVFNEEEKNLIVAKKGDCKVIVRLEHGLYCSLEIHLSGELGERATEDPYYRDLGVAAIAICLDPSSRRFFKKTKTVDDLREVLEIQKNELLKYCSEILAGDVSIWSQVVNCIKEKSKKSGFSR